jgi:hypothetical protein
VRGVTYGLPNSPFPGLEGMALLKNGALSGGSHLGNCADVVAMLQPIRVSAREPPSSCFRASPPRSRTSRTTRCDTAMSS